MMEFIDICDCLIKNVVGFVFSWLLLKKSRNIIPTAVVIVAGTIANFLFYKVSASVGYLLAALIYFFGNIFLSEDKLSKKVSVSMTATYIICISDFIFGSFIASISMKGFKQLREEWLIIHALSIAAFVPVYLLLRKVPQNTPNKFYSFFAGTMSGFCIVAIVVTGGFRGSAMNTSKENMIAAALVALLFYAASIIVIGFFSQLCVGANHEHKLLLLETNYKNFSEQIEIRKENERALKKFRHDIINYLSNIKGLISMNETDSALKLLEETAGKAEQSNFDLIDTGNVFADVVISSKAAVCRRKGIQFEFKSVSLKELKIEAADISSLLSNLLDNAAEAALKTSDPYIKLNIFEHNSYLVIRIENSVDEDIHSDNLQIKSTKADSSLHGCGMEIIREIAEKYNGNFIWKSEDNIFTSTVLIKMVML